MKRFLWVLIILMLAVLIGVVLIRLPGYVLVQIDSSSVAMPLWLAGIGLLLAFLILGSLYRLWSMVMTVPGYIKRIKQRRSMQRLQNAFGALLSRDWLKAEQHFKKLANNQFLLPYTQLMAAYCAGKTGRLLAQDHYVKTAHPVLAQDVLLIELAKLDTLLAARNWPLLLTQAQKLKSQYPSNPGLLRREIAALQELKAWQQIIELLPECKQTQIFTDNEYDTLAVRAYEGNLAKALRYSPQTIDLMWEAIPHHYQLDPSVVAVYVGHLLKAGQYEQAEKWLNDAVEQRPDARLFLLYSQIACEDYSSRLNRAEMWLKQVSVSAENLAVMAQICLSCRMIAKARHYAEQSLSIKPNALAYSVFAQIYELEGDTQKALKTYKQATALL